MTANNRFHLSCVYGTDDSNVWIKMGMEYIKTQQYKEAISAFNTAISIEPDNWIAWTNMGTAFWHINETQQALLCYNKVICEDPDNGIYTPVVCHLCDYPSCLEACVQEAISRNPQTGAIIISGKLCTGCGLCADACGFNAIAIHAEKNIAVTCDLCSGKPQCVKYCLQEAIIFSK